MGLMNSISLSQKKKKNSVSVFTQVNDLVLFDTYYWQIKREISTMKLIKHPNVLKLFEVTLCSHFDFNQLLAYISKLVQNMLNIRV